MKKLYSFRHPNYRRVKTEVSSESVTQSEFAKEADINYLVEKHLRSGVAFPTSSRDDFKDVSNVADFQAAQDAVITAREKWYSVPAKIRRHFGDNVENFLTALYDPERTDELVRLKVFKRPQQASQSTAAASPQGTGDPEPKAKGGGGKPPGTVST